MERKNRFFVLTAAMIFVTILRVFAQNTPNTVSGVVTDEAKQPLGGVIAYIINTEMAAITNNDGEYSIKFFDGDLLCFSYLGYQTIFHRIDSLKVNVQMTAYPMTILDDSAFHNPITVSGVVTDEAGRPLSGVVYTYNNHTSEVRFTTGSGEFSIPVFMGDILRSSFTEYQDAAYIVDGPTVNMQLKRYVTAVSNEGADENSRPQSDRSDIVFVTDSINKDTVRACDDGIPQF